jgi:hypothetical protein
MDLMDIAVDPAKEIQGAVCKIDKTTHLVVARWNNIPFLKMQAELTAPYIKPGGEGVDEEIATAILAKCVAKYILLGWEGLTIDGVDIPYSEQAVIDIFTDDRFRPFQERVLKESQRMENYRLEKFEGDFGNLKKQSSTRQRGRKKGRTSSKK